MSNILNKYLTVPKERLIALQWFDLKKLAEEEEQFRTMWKKKDMCNCISSLKENELPCCPHIREAIKNRFKQSENKIWGRSITIFLKSLPLDKILYKQFHGL